MNNRIVSFPHIGNYAYFVKPFLENICDCEVRIAPLITSNTVNLGNKYSPESICCPFKYNLGNYIETLENGSNTLFQFGGGCRYGNYAPLQSKILSDLGYDFEFYELVKNGKTSFKYLYNTIKEINPLITKKKLLKEIIIVMTKIMLFDKSEFYIRKKIPVVKDNFRKIRYKFINDFTNKRTLLSIIKTYFYYMRKYKKVKCKKPILKIGIIGELYTSMEPFSTFNLEDKLKDMGICIKRYTDVSYLLVYKKVQAFYIKLKSRKYIKYHLGADATFNVYRTLKFKKMGYDGIIHTKPFGCTPEVGVMPILSKISNEENIPIMFLSFDTQSSDEGITTRIEAFVDMLLMRKEKNNEK